MPNTALSIALAGVHEVDRVWPLVADGLERACRETGGDLTSHYLWTECRSGAAFLVIVSHDDDRVAASVWRFEVWSSGKKLRCLAMYGRNIRLWLGEHRTFVENMAKVGGATAIVTEGRKGFERLFPEATVLRQLYQMELP